MTGAVIAVLSVAGGAAAASAAMAAFQRGDFFENFSNNFHNNFRIGLTFLVGSALAAQAWGGGVQAAGGNGLNGWVSSKYAYGPAKLQGGLTIGSATGFNGVQPGNATPEGLTWGLHEFGHTVQYIGLSAFTGALQGNSDHAWAGYLGLGVAGLAGGGDSFWEAGADTVGGWF